MRKQERMFSPSTKQGENNDVEIKINMEIKIQIYKCNTNIDIITV